MIRVLAIETSCDDTSVAIVDDQAFVEICRSYDQEERHRPFGGIVPEIAARQHTEKLIPLVDRIMTTANWSTIDGIVVTQRPGLIGALMAGVVTAKTLAFAKKLPLIGVNHLEGHILAPFLFDMDMQKNPRPPFPFLALTVSGGHTCFYRVENWGCYRVLGRTIDDAAGEAFDKFAKMLGLGFPGGPLVDHAAKGGDPRAYSFPRPMLRSENFDMSFSGLKNAARLTLEKMADFEGEQANLCASFQEAVVDVLIQKLSGLAVREQIQHIAISGGVAANSRLRQRAVALAEEKKWCLYVPPLRYCTDNAAMVGFAGALRMSRGQKSDFTIAPQANSSPSDFL